MAITTARKTEEAHPVETCLDELLDHLGIASAHFAGRGSADLQGFASAHPERIVSLTLLCPAVLDTRTLAPLAGRLLVVTGDHGPGARRVLAALADLPGATAVVLDDYAGHTWADIAAERGDSIGAATQQFLIRRDSLPATGLPEQEGEVAGISFRLRGAGPPLVLLPLDLSPGQWEPLIPTAVGALLHDHPRRSAARQRRQSGGARSLGLYRRRARAARCAGNRPRRERSRSRLRLGCDHARGGAPHRRWQSADRPRHEPLPAARGAGIGATRWAARPYRFRRRPRRELPLADGAVDVALSSTVFEEGDADLMLSEIVRVTRPGGRIGVIVNAIDMPFWVNLPLDPALKAKVDAPGIIGGGMSPQGVADASLYRRLHALGLTGLKCFPQLVSVVPGSERIERYQHQILAALTPGEAETWRQAVAEAEENGTFFIAQAYHCAVGTKPG